MSTFNGRRGPNVTQYLRDLNTTSPQENPNEESFGMDADLALFTNTQFFDFESGQNTDFQPPEADPPKTATPADITPQTPADPDTAASTAATTAPSASETPMPDLAGMDFSLGGFSFPEFPTYPTAAVPPFGAISSFEGLPLCPVPSASTATSTPIVFPQPPPAYPSGTSPDQAHSPSRPMIGEKRKTLSDDTKSHNPEDQARVAAEEDKRRRNTAASARFRIKKKQREQALEKSAKEMVEKVTALQGRIQQLETENKWLKNLIMEKNDGSDEPPTPAEKVKQSSSSPLKGSKESLQRDKEKEKDEPSLKKIKTE